MSAYLERTTPRARVALTTEQTERLDKARPSDVSRTDYLARRLRVRPQDINVGTGNTPVLELYTPALKSIEEQAGRTKDGKSRLGTFIDQRLTDESQTATA